MSNQDNPARKKFEPMLSPFVDGELTPEERQQVEQHLAANKESAMQVADFRAASGLMRLTFEQQADAEDWKDFSNEVLAKLTPDKPPLFERLKASLAEMFTYQRGAFVGAMVTAALLVTVGSMAFLLGSSQSTGYANEQLKLQTVKVDQGAHVAPVVMETETGDAIIWMVNDSGAEPDAAKNDEKKKNDEELDPDPDAPSKKAGDL
ncbi:MAG: zf-HC2 domain-containing protein [Myxococcaceae bacterium]|nr:zf-HC2 domain-containing protein [Myxococcaceae bacterium]